MHREDELNTVRRAYAKQIMHAARANDPRLEEALAKLKREDFLPPGPWQLMRFPGGYQPTPDDDPIYLYQDAPVALLAEKRLNNGQPSFLTFLISKGELQVGEHAIHIGTGTGYYTAIIGYLTGETGHVTGIELEPELASRAAANLHDSLIYASSKAMVPKSLEPADVIYVNAGASRPADAWLDALKSNGRLILPLTVSFITDEGHPMTKGAIFLIRGKPIISRRAVCRRH